MEVKRVCVCVFSSVVLSPVLTLQIAACLWVSQGTSVRRAGLIAFPKSTEILVWNQSIGLFWPETLTNTHISIFNRRKAGLDCCPCV